jgi:hypothetical protein
MARKQDSEKKNALKAEVRQILAAAQDPMEAKVSETLQQALVTGDSVK